MANQHTLTVNRVRALPQNQKDCTHPDHHTNKAGWKFNGPGMYLHECPGCGKKTYFTIVEED